MLLTGIVFQFCHEKNLPKFSHKLNKLIHFYMRKKYLSWAKVFEKKN
jgi:hypothetical protein